MTSEPGARAPRASPIDRPAARHRAATPVHRAHEAAVARLVPACLATCMSALVSAVVTLVNTGVDGGVALRWLGAWALALPVAIAAAYLFRPLAVRMARRLAAFGR
jgi:hypothetical protein